MVKNKSKFKANQFAHTFRGLPDGAFLAMAEELGIESKDFEYESEVNKPEIDEIDFEFLHKKLKDKFGVNKNIGIPWEKAKKQLGLSKNIKKENKNGRNTSGKSKKKKIKVSQSKQKK